MTAAETETTGPLTTLIRVCDCLDDGRAQGAFLILRTRFQREGLSLASHLKPYDELCGFMGKDAYSRMKKLLRLTASDKNGEAIAAFMMAKRFALKRGLKLEQIFKCEQPTGTQVVAGLYPTLEVENIALKKRIQELRRELVAKDAEIQKYKVAFESMVETAWAIEHKQEQYA